MYVLYCIIFSYYVWPYSALCYIDLHCIALCVLLCHDLLCCTICTFCTYGIVHIVHIVPFYCTGLRTYVHCMLNYVVL